MICPTCHAEYQATVGRCATDGAVLVERLPEETDAAFAELEAALAAGTAALSAPRTLEDAKADRELLHEAGVPCLLYANPASAGTNGAATAYHLALLPGDLDAASSALGRKRRAMLDAEGLSVEAADAVVDLGAAEIVCPACGFSFAAKDQVENAIGACPDCGLYLGAPSSS